jgi:FkbM family methyltransferase
MRPGMTLRKIAKKNLAKIASTMPKGARQAIFAELARQFGIAGVQADGEYGRILSAVGDFAVFDVYACSGRWASHTNAVIEQFFVGTSGTYLDIGANIGLTLIPVARNRRVNCVAFEPDPTNFKNLQQNVRLNCEGSNVEIHNLALFNRTAELQFELAEGNFGDHRLRVVEAAPGAREQENRRTIVVSAVRLDDFMEVAHSPLAVKIDTQGAEPYVIEGGERLLSTSDLLIMEFSPYHIKHLGGDAKILIEFIKKNFEMASIAQREGSFGPDIGVRSLCNQLVDWISSPDLIYKRTYFDICLRK